MNRTSFIAACALMILALTLVARILLRETENRVSAGGKNQDSAAKPSLANWRQPEAPRSPASRGGAITSPSPESFTVRPGPHASTGSNGNASSPDERASKVEVYAHARLKELDGSLHLTPTQKRNVFPLLVRSSPGYDPSMVIGGYAGRNPGTAEPPGGSVPYAAKTDVSSAILMELDPDQQALYEEMLIDDGLWWAEIITKIDNDFQHANRDDSPPDNTTEDDTGAGENLFDLLGR